MTNGNWRPDRKIMAGALSALILWILQSVIPDLSIPIGIEGATVTIIGYLIPNPAA